MQISVQYFILGLIIFGLVLVGIFTGPSDFSIKEMFDGLLRKNDHISQVIIWDMRIPRILASIIVGNCLGLAGVLIQLSTRSSLGDPNLFGIGGGAAIFIAAGFGGLFVISSFFSLIGCIISSTLVALGLSMLISTPNLSATKLALMGIAVAALTISIGTAIISHGRVFPSQIIGLVSGSFSSSNWENVFYLLIIFCICFAISICLARKFFAIMLGDILTKSLGVNPIKIRLFAMTIVGVLSGVSVFSGGIIGFVGLVSPHISRRLFGNSTINLIISSSIIGGLITLFADQLARLLFAPSELPVGLATTILGAPTMMYLALKVK
ncbi:MAG: hypothetical protein CL786_04560 [Chloroflexi bacterium]|nr:hypothetical protein [Chloroflexota bacterium]MCH2307700.1 iron ABC transporter permease [SAR202 cluster bacterium]|tara:strand:+ start:1094 stop:2065 length:972 start_codon:yes stop_codon:yes gene_type:complete